MDGGMRPNSALDVAADHTRCQESDKHNTDHVIGICYHDTYGFHVHSYNADGNGIAD